MKELSVIVASHNAQDTISACLSSLVEQNKSDVAEIIVVDNSNDGTWEEIKQKFPQVQLVRVSSELLIPHLWAVGTERATGNVVAITTAHCVPDGNWVDEILRHHMAQFPAVGGAIENAQPSSIVQWAIYFCRYAGYMLPFSPHVVKQVPGDNASYKKWVLEKYADLVQGGFWETIVNNRLTHDGHQLLSTPSIRVYHGRSFDVWAFCRQRLVHGRVYGSQRAAGLSSLRRTMFILASPLIPLVFVGKLARQVVYKKRHNRVFLLCLPVLTLFVLSWSLGEFLGYLSLDVDKKELSKF